ncbi:MULTISPECIES: ABC transporter permease [Lactobacillaceae]|jgi:putative spermidine/putrescine transport system permease protein|uniref:ABC transporter, permease protein n=1 Tax=Loigolactobacillus coryniformis subsp. coryniformis CECT 5711 TaxID=1185325 RepID=J3JC40_9LACO|nr:MULTISPECIES: ABC transporter permease [Lactobacillaceae]EJN56257.1 ABC transporter, permease protein [Loigolactobacillus coryniformis subsp. coryniformis CECT 5711]MBZ1505456.1 ABC transporter permease [Latilactobacillus curvatus]
MRKSSAFWLILPAFLGVLLFVFYPLLQIAIPTFNSGSANIFSLYEKFLSENYNLQVIGRTILIAVITTIITLVLSFPVALWIARQKKLLKSLLSLLILFPMLTNAVVRNFAWIIILGKDGVINEILLSLHIISSPLNILYTNTSIIIGSIYLFLPIMIMSLIGSVSELNLEVEEAAAVLGARPLINLIKIIIPQLTTGILTGCILVFAGTMTAYTTPQILGGNRHLVMSTLIYQQAMTLGNWTNASVIAIILIVISALTMLLMGRVMKKIDRRSINA